MNRPISTRTHGMIDYAWAATATALPETMSDEADATKGLLRTAALAATVSSLITNYEAGAVGVLPMKAHLAIDYAMCGALLAAPLFLPAHERRWAAAPMALGAAGLMTSLLTQTRSTRELDAAIDGDLDIRRQPGLRTHIE